MKHKIPLSLHEMFFYYDSSENLPIYTSIILVLAFFASIICLHYILKKLKIWGQSRKIINAFFNLLFIFAFFGVLEYQAGQVQEIQNRTIFTNQCLHEMDTLLLWKSKRNQKKTPGPNFGWSYSTDSNGLRSTVEIPLKKEKNEFRILALGDSWTFGHSVNDYENYCYYLERELQAKYPHRKIRVINAGCSAWCIAQGYIYFRMRGIKYNPDLVIVKNFLNGNTNDLFINLYPLPSSEILKSTRLALWQSKLYLYLRRIILRYEKLDQQVDYTLPSKIDDRGYTIALLKELDDFCREKKIKVMYLNSYFKERIFFGEAMHKMVSGNKVNYLEVGVDFAMEPEHIKLDSHHPGPKNHLRIAQELAKYIEENKLVGE